MRDVDAINACVDATVAAFGRIDILINNASALWWQDVVDTPVKKYDLITSINSRGTFFFTKVNKERPLFIYIFTYSSAFWLDQPVSRNSSSLTLYWR
jgi:NAD(P)-dependent dehydrogenase (short-subunit alcohol dehydrogenase family)